MGFLIGFSPWIIYWILVGNTSFRVAVIVALCLAVLAVAVQRLRKQPWHTLEAGAVLVFAMFTVLAFTVSDTFLERWLQPLGNAAIFLIALVGMVIGRPFVREYARASVTDDVARSDGFRVITSAMTWMWIAVFGVMTVVSLIPPLVQGDATIRDGASTLSIVCYWVVPFTLLGVAGTVSGVFPAWFSSHTDAIGKRQVAARPGDPVAQPDAPADVQDPRVVVRAPSTSRHDEPFSIGVDAAGIPDLTVSVSGQDLFGRPWRWQGRLAAPDNPSTTSSGRWRSPANPIAPTCSFLPRNRGSFVSRRAEASIAPSSRDSGARQLPAFASARSMSTADRAFSHCRPMAMPDAPWSVSVVRRADTTPSGRRSAHWHRAASSPLPMTGSTPTRKQFRSQAFHSSASPPRSRGCRGAPTLIRPRLPRWASPVEPKAWRPPSRANPTFPSEPLSC